MSPSKMSRNVWVFTLVAAVVLVFGGIAWVLFTVSGAGLGAGELAEVEDLIVSEGNVAKKDQVFPEGTGVTVNRGESHAALFVVATLTDSSGSGPILSDEDVICIGESFRGVHPIEATLNAYHNAVLVGSSFGSDALLQVVIPASQTSPGDEVSCEAFASETLPPFFGDSFTTTRVVQP